MASAATAEERAELARRVREASGEPEASPAPARAPGAAAASRAPRRAPAAPRTSVGEAAEAYATQSGATESVSVAMAVVLVMMVIAGGWLGLARDWTFNAVGKAPKAAPATQGATR